MTIEIKVPVLPESVEDATIAGWHKKPGDSIKRDENLVDLETDKVVLEVPSPVDGTLIDIKAAEGATVVSNDLLAILETGESSGGDSEADSGPGPGPDTGEGPDTQPGEETPGTDEKQPESGSEPEKPESAPSSTTGAAAPAQAREHTEEGNLSPAVRRMVAEEQVDPSRVAGTGRGGRITKADVVQFIKGGGARPEERVKMTRLRSRIAERLKAAQNTAAILTSFNEVDLKSVMDLRRKYKEEFIEKHGIKLGLMSFFVRACVEALRKFPVVNASIDNGEIVYHGFQDIGIAVSTERGLMVPVVRDAQSLGLAEIEMAIAHYAQKARDGSIALEDLQGGTFTITNGGVFGSMLSTPLLNPPQSAILGMHAIKDRPVVVDGEVVVRPMMYIALSYDHRLVDGKDSVQFLVAVKEALEDPARMLLNI
jgi:2-oxoglutarate dehydrogenase E2 component (dihydrolipoamide succinyltransferase)